MKNQTKITLHHSIDETANNPHEIQKIG